MYLIAFDLIVAFACTMNGNRQIRVVFALIDSLTVAKMVSCDGGFAVFGNGDGAFAPISTKAKRTFANKGQVLGKSR